MHVCIIMYVPNSLYIDLFVHMCLIIYSRIHELQTKLIHRQELWSSLTGYVQGHVPDHVRKWTSTGRQMSLSVWCLHNLMSSHGSCHELTEHSSNRQWKTKCDFHCFKAIKANLGKNLTTIIQQRKQKNQEIESRQLLWTSHPGVAKVSLPDSLQLTHVSLISFASSKPVSVSVWCSYTLKGWAWLPLPPSGETPEEACYPAALPEPL